MIDIKRARDIVHALRSTGTIDFCYKNAKSVFPEWIESVTDDAADVIEALISENERISEELMVMRIKMTGDCGVCQHQYINVQEEPCASCITTEEHINWAYEGDGERGEY